MSPAQRDEAFTEFVTQRHRHLVRAAYLLCGDRFGAEDLAQSTLVSLYRAWPRVARADNVDAYVRRVLVNKHRDESRRPWRREHPVSDPAMGPSQSTPDAADTDELMTALRALPEGQRRVVVLRHYWGLSVEETAADLGISTGTVKSQTARALSALERLLQPQPDHP